jgi:hypothetical protein
VIATLGASQASDTASVSATPQSPAVTHLTLNPDSVTAGSPSTGTVTLDCEAPSGGATVTLSSDNPSVATVQAPSMLVPQDQTSGSFQINTVGVGTATITATGPSGPPMQATLQVQSLPT